MFQFFIISNKGAEGKKKKKNFESRKKKSNKRFPKKAQIKRKIQIGARIPENSLSVCLSVSPRQDDWFVMVTGHISPDREHKPPPLTSPFISKDSTTIGYDVIIYPRLSFIRHRVSGVCATRKLEKLALVRPQTKVSPIFIIN